MEPISARWKNIFYSNHHQNINKNAFKPEVNTRVNIGYNPVIGTNNLLYSGINEIIK